MAQRSNIKDIIRDEYKMCASSPEYFIRKYCMIRHPIRGKIKFELYPFQKKMLVEFIKNSRNIILKNRQMGLSTLTSVYALWVMTFNENKFILTIATKQDVAKNIIDKVRFAHTNLPSWLKLKCIEDNKLGQRYINGSQIVAGTSTSDAGRSEAVSLLIIDEAGHIYNFSALWGGLQPTLSTGGDIIVLSTPNGFGNWFSRTWTGAEENKNNFVPTKLHWTMHPERDQTWRDLQDIELGPRLARQECLSGNTVITIRNKKTGIIEDICLGELVLLIYNIDNEYEILTPTGFQSFDTVTELDKNEYLIITLENGNSITSSLDHPFIVNKKEIEAKSFNVSDYLETKDGNVIISDIHHIKENIKLYDIINVNGGHIFYANNIISGNCDGDFLASGDGVVDGDILQWYKETYIQEPLEKTGFDKNVWLWEYPDDGRSYILTADVARGDAADYSAFHIFDLETLIQVGEYRGKISTKQFGDLCIEYGTKYNDAILVIENTNIGWATVQRVIDRNYPNLFYSNEKIKYIDPEKKKSNKLNAIKKKTVAGFSITSDIRPLMISKMEQYFNDKTVTLRSIRTLNELFTFVWNGGKAEAAPGYHDDLVMCMSQGLWVRDTAIRLITQQNAILKQTLDSFKIDTQSEAILPSYTNRMINYKNQYKIKIGNHIEDFSEWL